MENSREKQPLLGSFNGDVDKTTSENIKKSLNELVDFVEKAWEMGWPDPWKMIFGIKMGVALSVVSLLMFCKSINSISQYSIYAILTVILMYEYTIGAAFIRGFNQLLGTLFAGILAFAFAELSLTVDQWEAVIVYSIFITGFFASYLKLFPTMKPFGYGFRVFVLTYCMLMVAGSRSRTIENPDGVVTRLVPIALGAFVCVFVNVCVYFILSGNALHSLVVKNLKDVANSLEGCVNGYLRRSTEYENLSSKNLIYQEVYDDTLYNGYRSAVEFTSKEKKLLEFANWETAHGRHKISNFPWRNYVEICGALRHCAFMVMALNGCILSQLQAPAAKRQVFESELQRVAAEAAKVLRKLGSKIDKKEKLGHENILQEVHEAAEQLQRKMVKSESWDIANQPMQFQGPDQNIQNAKKNENNVQLGAKSSSESETVIDLSSVATWKQATWPSILASDANEEKRKTYESASALSLATFASLLIEFVARLQCLVQAFEELSQKAEFKEPIIDSEIGKKKAAKIRCFRLLN